MDYFFYNTDADCLREQPKPRYPVLIAQGCAASGGPREFGEKLGQLAMGDILLMYENDVGVVAVGRVKQTWDGETHTRPMYYTLDEMQTFPVGPPHEYRIAVEWFLDLSRQPYAPISLDELRARLGYTPRGTIQKIVTHRAEVIRMIDGMRLATALLPEEIVPQVPLTEGATCQIVVNAYERNPEARRRCIEHHGTACTVCGFDFGTVYGPDIEGYIHVHHIRPLSEVEGEYLVNPVEDLRPVCPNCHAVLHVGGRCRTIEEVRAMLKKQATRQSSFN